VTQMHSAGVVHRDLKPENICFTRPDHAQIKLIDMGAAGFDGPDGLSELCGTPLYAAPEVTPWFYVEDAEAAARCPRYGKEVDYWSMGVALYVMLSGEAPFEQDQPVERLLADVCRGKLDFSAPRWAKISAAARGLIRGLLTTDPKARMQLAAIRAHPWLAEEIARLQQQPATPPPLAAAAAPRPHEARPSHGDLELLGVLAFLPQCVSSAGGPDDAAPSQVVGDLRLHVLPETRGESAQLFTLRVDDHRHAFILPGAQDARPVASLACRREQLLRWVAGLSPLVPSAFELPASSRLATFLRNFAPDEQRFRAFCREKGVVPSKSLRRHHASDRAQRRRAATKAAGKATSDTAPAPIEYDANAYSASTRSTAVQSV